MKDNSLTSYLSGYSLNKFPFSLPRPSLCHCSHGLTNNRGQTRVDGQKTVSRKGIFYSPETFYLLTLFCTTKAKKESPKRKEIQESTRNYVIKN